MPIATSRMTSKGQVTIPAELRAELRLKPHDRVGFELTDGVVTLRRVTNLMDLYGVAKYEGPPIDWKQLREEFEQYMADEGMKGVLP